MIYPNEHVDPAEAHRMLREASRAGEEDVRRTEAFLQDYVVLGGDTLSTLRERLLRPIEAVPSYLDGWNRVCRSFGGGKGWAFGWYVVVGGKTGLGKSIQGANICAHAVEHGFSAVLHSTEMEWDDNAVRVLAILTDTEAWKLEPGPKFSPTHFDRAVRELEAVYERTGGRFATNRIRRRRLTDVRDGILAAWEVEGARLHVVDYLQLIATGGKGYYSEDINARVAEISETILQVTEDNDLVTVGLSQLNRDGIKSDRRPEPYMLYGGAALENDSRQVALLDHTRVIDLGADGWNGWLIIPKNRHGPSGVRCDIPIHVSRRTLRTRERLPDEVSEEEKIDPNPRKEKCR